jgi:alpha-L-fucosidase 2
VKGLLARGGFEVSATWKNGTIVSAAITSKLGKPAIIRLQGNPSTITLNESTKLSAKPDGTFRFDTKKGETYQLVR